MDSQRNSRSTIITLFVFLGLLQSAFAAEYTVGGNSGWVIPSQNAATFFDSQFTNINLVIGDTLKFPYSQGAHNVYIVSQADLQSCDGTNPIEKHDEANAVIALNRTGSWSFICEIAGHCSAGMHLQVTVGGASTPTTAPVQAPVSSPVQAPVSSPVQAPVSSPVQAPVSSPVQAPVSSPVQAPVSSPVQAPVSSPVQAPVSTPVQAPVPAPVRAPTPASLRAPTLAPGPSTVPFGVSPSMSQASSPESGLSPEGMPMPGSGAHSGVSVQLAVVLSSAAACLAMLFL